MAYHYRHTPGDHRLIVTLHGTGGNESQFHGFVEQVVPGASILSPRGDVSEHGAARFFRRRAEGVYDMDDLWMRVDQMADFVRDQRVENVTRRCIGIGYSNGANILMATALKHPHVFDALILMHPLIPWTPDPSPDLAGKPVFISAGQRDPICPMPSTEALLSYLGDQGAEVTTHISYGGHEIRDDELMAVQTYLREQADVD